MLGWMGTEAAIGYYAAGERLVKAVQRMISSAFSRSVSVSVPSVGPG
jgi:hypothetical protein